MATLPLDAELHNGIAHGQGADMTFLGRHARITELVLPPVVTTVTLGAVLFVESADPFLCSSCPS